MKAIVLEKNKKLMYREVAAPELIRGRVLVKVLATGFCSSDFPRAFEHGAYHYPLVMGHEICGLAKVNGHEKMVTVYPLIFCRKCVWCRQKQYPLCTNYSYLGSREHGGMAEYVQVPPQNLIPLPSRMDLFLGVLAEPTAVAIHAFHRTSPQRRDRVLIMGDGAIGLLLAGFLRYQGFKNIFLLGKYDHKLALAEKFGAKPLYWNQNSPYWKQTFDCIFELAGTNSAYTTALLAAKTKGKIVLTGNIKEDLNIPKNIFPQILRKELQIEGSWNSLLSDWKEAVNFLHQNPAMAEVITHRLSLPQAPKFLTAFHCQKPADFIKLIITNQT